MQGGKDKVKYLDCAVCHSKDVPHSRRTNGHDQMFGSGIKLWFFIHKNSRRILNRPSEVQTGDAESDQTVPHQVEDEAEIDDGEEGGADVDDGAVQGRHIHHHEVDVDGTHQQDEQPPADLPHESVGEVVHQ